MNDPSSNYFTRYFTAKRIRIKQIFRFINTEQVWQKEIRMNRFKSLKDIEKEKYRLYLERELSRYKLNYFIRNAKNNWSPEKLIQNSIGSLVYRFVTGIVHKKENA